MKHFFLCSNKHTKRTFEFLFYHGFLFVHLQQRKGSAFFYILFCLTSFACMCSGKREVCTEAMKLEWDIFGENVSSGSNHFPLFLLLGK